MRCVTYSKAEENIVEKGFTSIQEVLMGTDDDAKASLLFCLDKYLDPYYGYKLAYENDIFNLLETVVVSPNSMDIREDALNLLTSYAGGPFPIIEKHYDDLAEAIKPDAKYAVNMYAMWRIAALVLDECVKIFRENEITNHSSNMGEFPKSAIVVFNTEGTEDGEGYDNYDTIEEIWEIVDGKYTVKGISIGGIPRAHNPVSGVYYPVGEFYFNADIPEKEVYLSYIFGPRFGKGIKYQIQMDEETGEFQALVKPQLLWVM